MDIFKGRRVKKITAEQAEKAIKQGMSPAHPALSRVVRDNVVKVDFSKKKSD
jgi:hypothetical protein